MKIMMAVTAAALSTGVAGAQKFEVEDGVISLVGCYQVKNDVKCDLTYTSKTDNNRIRLYKSAFQVVTPSGDSRYPDIIGLGANDQDGKSYAFSALNNTFSGVPVKGTLIFQNLKVSSLAVFSVSGADAIRNVPVRGSGASAPVATPAPVQQVNLSGNWQGTLSNCRAAGNNTYVCAITIKK
ncbi:hypothetical protein D3875_07330 [Deinococcus cavernae]|uniref:Uncharacterized protein n=2 Tax=Deinococcus cavernae TaxID=2320857 RepID=A0A418V5M9_9DEIO|nr:hypothetical protein D3875_07330 [Deinococcus cavernae]